MARQVRVKFKDFDSCCDHAFQQYAIERPTDYALDMAYIKQLREEGGREKQWSEGRTFLHVAEIPRFVHGIIDIYYRGWLKNKEYRDRFLHKFAQLRMDDDKFSGTKGYAGKENEPVIFTSPTTTIDLVKPVE